jgi:hypothetical protein
VYTFISCNHTKFNMHRYNGSMTGINHRYKVHDDIASFSVWSRLKIEGCLKFAYQRFQDIQYSTQVNPDIRVFEQCGFRLIWSPTFITFLKFQAVRPIMKQTIFNNAKTNCPKTVACKQCCQIMFLPRH